MTYKIIAIGDSHVLWSFKDLPEFIIIHLGPRTAYNIPDHHDQIKEELAKHPDLPIIFNLGEIDCRLHVQPQSVKQNKTICSIIEEVVDIYTNYLAVLQARRENKIYAMNIDVAGDVDKLAEGFYLTWEQFNIITLSFNEQLEKACVKKGIGFIDIYDQMIDPATGRKKIDWRQICEVNGLRDWAHCNNRVGLAILEKYFKPK
jgi:hypothetical protein